MDGGVFLYEALTPLGEAPPEGGERDERFTFDAPFLPLQSGASPRREESVAEPATSTVTVERRESTAWRSAESVAGRSLQSLIAAEKDLLAATSSPAFNARADTSGSGDLGVVSKRSALANLRGGGAEERADEAEFISLETAEENGEAVVESDGKRVEGVVDGSATPKVPPPWARGRESWIQSPLLQLHQEIVDFCEFVAPTEEEQQMRAVAVQRVSAVVKSIWPSCEVKVFGSFATGLYLPTSDVDVVVLESGCQNLQDGLRALAKALTRGQVAKSIQVIGKARVPIIKFVETVSNVPFDISFDVANGPEAADFIKSAMGAIPPLRPLCLVLKIFLQQRELNEVYQGGIGSYALLVMILTHLQMHPSKRRASNRGEGPPLESNLGILLVDFLDLYGRTLNMKDVGVSCRGGGKFFRKRDRGFNDQKRPFLLSVEDPQSPDNDIGKNSYAIQKVRSALMMAHRLLTDLDGDSEVGLLSRIVRMDAKLVGRKAPASVPWTPSSVGAKRARRATFSAFYNEAKAEAEAEAEDEEEPYVVGDGTFSNSDSGDAVDLKTPVSRGRRGRWQDYEEEDFPRGESVDGYLAKKAKRAKKHKEQAEGREALFGGFGHDRYKESPRAPQGSRGEYSNKRARGGEGSQRNGGGRESVPKRKGNTTESSELEEGEVGLSRRGRRREEVPKRKDERQRSRSVGVASDGAKPGEGGKAAAGRNGHKEHTHVEGEGGSSRSSKKYSRFKERGNRREKGSRDWREGSRGEAAAATRRIVVTRPAHKKIKYVL